MNPGSSAISPDGTDATGDGAPIAPAGPTAPATPSLGRRTLGGFVWATANTVVSKLLGLLGQIVLAKLLLPEDFGLVAMALTVAAFVNIVRDAGLQQVLVHRGSEFQRWAGPAAWMSGTLGVGAMLVMAAAAPLAAWFYQRPELSPLILMLAIGSPLWALGAVPSARLQVELRFGATSAVAFLTTLLTLIGNVAMAWNGYGAYSFILPLVVVGAIRTIVLWCLAGTHVGWSPRVSEWRYLLKDSLLLLVTHLLIQVPSQADYILLGAMHSAAVVGAYFFAFNLSMQTIVLLTMNLAAVLFPALSKIQSDPAHQTRSFLRASRMVAIVGVPACFLQAAIADPAFRLLFAAKWEQSVPVFQILSVGTAFTVMGASAVSLIQAQGRFRTLLWWAAVIAVSFLCMVYVGARTGGAVSVAVAVSLYFAIFGPAGVRIAVGPGGGTWKDVARLYLAPLASGAIAAGLPVFLVKTWPALAPNDWVELGFIVVATGAIYVPLIRWTAAEDYRALLDQVGGLVRPMLMKVSSGKGS